MFFGQEGIGCGKLLARERTTGQGTRLLRGEEHKDLDAVVRIEKQEEKNDVKAQKEQTSKDTTVRAVIESGVMLCRNCVKPFSECQKCVCAHRFVLSTE